MKKAKQRHKNYRCCGLIIKKSMIQSLIAGFLSVKTFEGTSISMSFFAASNDTLEDGTDICKHSSWNY